MSSGKVKCTCGWSWNKSDSSKKDMYICHECGRDNSNNMQNGGWLDNYADGGTMQEHQENYNDYKVSAPKGMVGDGYSNVGRNYSPAWGGQFQMGGQVPKRRGVRYNEDGSVSTHLMKTETDGKGNWFSFPTLFQNSIPYADDSENWLDMSDRPWEEVYEEAKKRGEVINFGSDKDAAIKFGQGSWKDKKQMGGSIPGAVGFSYARTQSPAPSNGPYAKKTKASAQEGIRLDMYGAPITAIEVNDPSVSRTIYDPRTNRMILGSDTNAENRDKVIAHENYHASQYLNNMMNYDIAHQTDDEQWARMQKQPSMVSTDNVWSNYYDRKPREINDFINRAIDNSEFLRSYANTVSQGSPSVAGGLVGDTIYDRVNIDKQLYLDPRTSEGEAQRYEDTGIRSYKNGGWLDQYDVAQEGEELPSVRSLINDTMNRKIQGKGKGKEVKTVQKDNTKTVTPKEIKKLSGIQQNKLAQQQSEEQAAKDWVQNSMQEAYQSPLMSPGYFTPEGATIGALQGATKLGPDLYEGDYKGAAMDALMALPIAIPASKVAGQLTKQGLREGVDLFHPVGRALRQIEQEGIASGLSAQEIKKLQLEKVGITSLQREGYFPGVSEIVTEYITPYSYENAGKRILDIPRRIIKGETNFKNLSNLDHDFVFNHEAKNLVSKPRYDAWRMYSGLPQKNNTFRIAETAPIDHPSYSPEQLNNLEKFSLNNESKLLNSLPQDYDLLHLLHGEPEDLVKSLPDLKSKLQNIQDIKNEGMDIGNDFMQTNVMGGYNRRYFDNKMEYNDIWDLDLQGNKVEKYFGKPFLSHGQLDYSFEPAENEIKKLIERGQRYEKNANKYIKTPPKELYIDPKLFNNKLNQKDLIINKKQKEGGIIKDDREQWVSAKNGGWLNKYDVAEDGIETTTDETTKPVFDFSKAKQDLKNIMAESKARKNKINTREVPRTVVRDVIPTIKNKKEEKPKKQYEAEDISNLDIPSQVINQIDYVKYSDNPKQNFGVVDKENNVMYYVNPNGQIIGHENVITGATNTDRETAPSMKEYGKTANEYYDYLKNTNQRVTPAGKFTLYSNNNNSVGKPHSLWDRAIGALPFVDDVRLNTLDDPSLMHAIYNEMPWREEENKEYYDHRKESYGPSGNMFRMVSQYGVPSSKGVHGTGNKNRITALNNQGANRNLSNGCINVGGKTMCFDMLGNKSNLYVLPETQMETPISKAIVKNKTEKYQSFVNNKDLNVSRQDIQNTKNTKNKISEIINTSGINATPEEINFATAVAQKETKGGTSLLNKLESVLPGFSSYGLYEQKEDFPYLKGKSPNDEVASTQAVIDFYRDMQRKYPELKNDITKNEKLYSTYNSGRTDWDKGIYHGKDFRKILQSLNEYKDGGVIKDDMGQWAHPGEVTEIDSNDITMEGVPYDVLGISDTGDTKLMKPGKKYKFKGKKVTEFPMAKNGLRQEQKGLVNLDQLTNFTNYNTKQPGGWLDQY